jgi:signal transduction histidine kinase
MPRPRSAPTRHRRPPRGGRALRLSEFVTKEKEAILLEWEAFARTLTPAATDMSPSAIRDHGAEILDAIALDMETAQSGSQQSQKSKGRDAADGKDDGIDAVGHVHAGLRLEAGFDLDQLISEYRALRASVIRLWEQSLPETTRAQRGELIRFNEAIDQMLAESVRSYTRRVNRYRDQFLGILGHDLRNPLGAIVMSATYLSRDEELGAKHLKSAARILNGAQRMGRMVDLLLDLTRTRLGTGIPISRQRLDLRALCRQVLDELEAFHPDRLIQLEAAGEVHGAWDSDRLAQVLSNLVGNALQYGRPEAPITVSLRDEGKGVTLTVHNEGPPIPDGAQATLFDPLVRQSQEPEPTGNLGLGLYIVREIVASHGGEVKVASSRAAGTTFTVRLPRAAPAEKGKQAKP